jgi:hypothetical protein
LSSFKLLSSSSGTQSELSIVSVSRKSECLIWQTEVSDFKVWVLEYILCESISIGSSGYCYSFILYIKCLEVKWIDFVLNSMTKSEGPIC